MKILLTTHQFLPDFSAGTEILTYSVARELMKRGHIVSILTGYPSAETFADNGRFDEYDYDGIHVYRFHHNYETTESQPSKIEIGFDNNQARDLFSRLLLDFEPDLVHFFHLNRLGIGLIESADQANVAAYMTPTDFWAICPTGQLLIGDRNICNGPNASGGNCVKHFATTQSGRFRSALKWIPNVFLDILIEFTKRGLVPNYPYRVEVLTLSSRLKRSVVAMNKLRKIISPNQYMTEKLLQYGVLPHLITQSTFGVEEPELTKKHIRTKKRAAVNFAYIGTLAPHKGCDVLIKAFRKIPTDCANLTIYGGLEDFPEFTSKLKRLASNNDNVKFAGTFDKSQLSEVFSKIDALIVPSVWIENTPLVIYHSHAHRCPVLASNLPGLKSAVNNDIDGLLFKVGDIDDLTAKLNRLIFEPKLLQTLSSNIKNPKTTKTYVDELLVIWKDSVKK